MEKLKKYQEANRPLTGRIKEGQFRVWHIPQIPMHAFRVYVDSLKEAKLILETLAIYDLFQLEYKIKPDYSNASGLEIFENNEWSEYYDDDGCDIDEIIKEDKNNN